LIPNFSAAYRIRWYVYDSLGNHQQATKDCAKNREVVDAAALAGNSKKTTEEENLYAI
jgi:hypothetical protein